MKKGLAFLFFNLCIFCVANSVSAAMLYMEPREAELKRGDVMIVSVRLDNDVDECINVVDAVITYSENIQLIDTSRGNSILSLWVEEPTIDKANRTVSFAGGIPNGYCGRIPGDPRLTNNVVDLLFQSPGLQIGSGESGNIARIDFASETHVLLNDGLGTAVSPQLYGATVLLSREAGQAIENPWQMRVSEDTFPPEKFSITLTRTENAYSNKYFITFNTTDKQSGIDHYEVIEEPLDTKNLFGWGAATAPWIEARSPYVLKDQSLNSTIRVKAIDKAGNEYVATFVPGEELRTLSEDNLILFITVGGVGVSVIALSFFIFFWFVRKKKRYQTVLVDNEEQIED